MQISVRNTRLIVVSQFLSALYFTIPIWIPYYLGRITISQISFFIAFQYAIQLFMELPTGALADLIGRKKTVILGYFTMAISSLLLIVSPSFLLIFIATIFAGLSEAFISGALEALLYDSYKQDGRENEFQKAQTKSSLFYQVGLAIGTLSGGFMYHIWHGLPFLLQGLVALASTIVSFSFVEPTIDSIRFTLRNYVKQMIDGTKHAFETKKVAIVSLFYIAVAGITWTNQMYFHSFMLVELGFSDQTRGAIGAAQRLFNVFVLGSLLKNQHIFTQNRSIMFFPIMMIVCFLPGIFFSGWGALPFVTGALMVGTARWIILTRFTNSMFDSKYRATAISALSMLAGFIYIAITLVSGPVIERYGGVRAMYSILGILTILFVVPLSVGVLRVLKKQLIYSIFLLE